MYYNFDCLERNYLELFWIEETRLEVTLIFHEEL